MKTQIRTTAITSIALLVLLMGGSGAVYAHEPSHSSQNASNLSMSVIGGVSNLGNQVYSVSGGRVAFAAIEGKAIDPATATLHYSMVTSQVGLTTNGTGSFQLSGKTTGGMSVSASGQINFGGMNPAAELPVGCTTACTSALPFFFIGTSNVQVTMAGTTQTLPETMQIESPYFNPFGAPIVLASADSAIVIAATYTRGTIQWTGTQFAGQIVGLLGTTQVSGVFNMTSSERENLVKGTANDKGTMSFNSMTPSSLNVKGSYTGSSTIPTTNTSDCSFLTGIPSTCTETGFQSSGKFWMGESSPTASDHESGHSSGSNGKSQSISGSYSGTWGVPALGCLTSITATLSQTSND